MNWCGSQLDVEASKNAVSKVADRLQMTLHDAARGIIDIVNEKMFGALRLVSVEQGKRMPSFLLDEEQHPQLTHLYLRHRLRPS